MKKLILVLTLGAFAFSPMVVPETNAALQTASVHAKKHHKKHHKKHKKHHHKKRKTA